MTNRTTILVVLVLLAVAAAFAMMQKAPPRVDNSADTGEVSSADLKGRTLSQERDRNQKRLAKLEAMTPAQWSAELKDHPKRHGTLDEAKKRLKDRMDKLNSVTPEQWDAVHNGAAYRQTKPNARSFPTLAPSPQP